MWKTQGKCRISGIITDENVFQRIISPELLREKFENDLEISGKIQGIKLLKNVATLENAALTATILSGSTIFF